MTQVLKNKKGVTLVELLAVIVIMGIIAAIAVPAIGGLISNSREKAAIAVLDQIEEAARLYAIDNLTGTAVTPADLQTADYIDLNGATFVDFTFDVTNGDVSFNVSGTSTITFNGTIYTITGSAGNWGVS